MEPQAGSHRRVRVFGHHALRKAIDEYVAHYNAERPHQGVGNQPLSYRPPPDMGAEVAVHERLGGLLKSYRRAA
ncbi:MAG: integrase core domain-containing protein [Planctomycetota bacterium]|nr:integrase core domain-containing protein [Planctomycetota bacterium]